MLVRDDGRPFDRWRATTALHRAANAAGVDHTRLTPHTAATALLDAKAPHGEVFRQFHYPTVPLGSRKLDSHAAYRMAALLAGGA